MLVIAVSAETFRIRAAVRTAHPHLKSSHLSEAFARGLGFGSHAAFLAWDRTRLRSEEPIRTFDPTAASERLGQLGAELSPADLTSAIASCEGTADLPGFAEEVLADDQRFNFELVTAATRRLPDGKGARAGHVGILMNWRLGLGYGMMDFVERYCLPRSLHLRLAACISASEALDPAMAKFLIDCLQVADAASNGGAGYPKWRDEACRTYAMRTRAFVYAMMHRGPLGEDPFEGPVPATASVERRRIPGLAQLEPTMRTSEDAGFFDAGLQGPDPRSMVGCASMALWRHGDDDGEIEIFRREAGIDAASAMSEWFGIAAIEATTGLGASAEPHPLEGIAEATTPGLPDISIVTAEEAAVAFERAERQDRFSGIRKIDGPDPADELGYTDPYEDADFVWISVRDGGDLELLEQIVEAAAVNIDVMVSGLAPWAVNQLEEFAARTGFRFAISPTARAAAPLQSSPSAR
jgi:hypothetical protein